MPWNRLQNEQSLPQYRSPGSGAPSDSFSDLEDTYAQLPLPHSPPPPLTALSNINMSNKSPEPIPSPSTAVDTSFESRADRNRRLALERLEARRRLEQSQTISPLYASGKFAVRRYSSPVFWILSFSPCFASCLVTVAWVTLWTVVAISCSI